MKKYIITLSCLLCIALVHAQNTINIASGTKVVQSGAVQVAYNAGNFVNNGTYTDTSGTTLDLGGMTFSGSGNTMFYLLNINHASTSTLSSLVSVKRTTTLTAGALNMNTGNLYLRSDINPFANLLVTGVLTGTAQGLMTYATATTGPCPLSSTLSVNVSGPAVVYQWQSSPDNSTWSNIPGATLATYAATVTVTAYFRCNLSTNNSSFTEGTPGVLLTPTGGSSISASSPVAICSGQSTVLSVSGGTTYSWSPAIGLSGTTGAAVTASPTVTTIYSVIGYTSGCSGTATVTVSVNPLPAVATTAGGPTTFCAGGAVSITSSRAAGNGLQFNGINAGIDIVPTSSVNGLGSTAFTLEAWVNSPSSASGAFSIIRKSKDYNLYLYNNQLYMESWYLGTGNATFKKISGSVTIPVNTWTHVAATYDGLNYVLYVNGVADATPTVVVSTSSVSENLHLGYSSLFLNYFSGKMDEVRIWNIARSGVEIAAGMSVGVAPASTGLKAYYKFDESTGPTMIDATGNGNTGTPSGSPVRDIPSSAPINFNSYLWSPGGSTATSISAIASGSYSVTVSNGTCSNTSTGINVSVNALPTITSSTNVAICNGSSTTLSASGGLTYSWSPSTGLSSTTGASVTAIPTVTTTYTVTGYNSGSCANTAIVTVSVNPSPSAITGAMYVYTGGTITLSDVTVGGSWSSSNTLVARVGSAGLVTGVSAGTSIISYTTASGCSATAVVTDTTAANAGALNFQGIELVSVPDNSALDFGSGDFTVEGYMMKLSNAYYSSTLAGKWNTGATRGSNEWLLTGTFNGTDNLPSFVIESGSTEYAATSSTTTALGTWYHYAAVRHGTSMELYVNGSLVASNTIPSGTVINNTGLNMNIGWFQPGAPIHSAVSLDEIRIWNRALCQAEIANSMSC